MPSSYFHLLFDAVAENSEIKMLHYNLDDEH